MSYFNPGDAEIFVVCVFSWCCYILDTDRKGLEKQRRNIIFHAHPSRHLYSKPNLLIHLLIWLFFSTNDVFSYHLVTVWSPICNPVLFLTVSKRQTHVCVCAAGPVNEPLIWGMLRTSQMPTWWMGPSLTDVRNKTKHKSTLLWFLHLYKFPTELFHRKKRKKNTCAHLWWLLFAL